MQCYSTHTNSEQIFACDHCHPTPAKQAERAKIRNRAVAGTPNPVPRQNPDTTSATDDKSRAQNDQDVNDDDGDNDSANEKVVTIRNKRKPSRFVKTSAKRTRSAPIIQSGSDTDEI